MCLDRLDSRACSCLHEMARKNSSQSSQSSARKSLLSTKTTCRAVHLLKHRSVKSHSRQKAEIRLTAGTTCQSRDSCSSQSAEACGFTFQPSGSTDAVILVPRPGSGPGSLVTSYPKDLIASAVLYTSCKAQLIHIRFATAAHRKHRTTFAYLFSFTFVEGSSHLWRWPLVHRHHP